MHTSAILPLHYPLACRASTPNSSCMTARTPPSLFVSLALVVLAQALKYSWIASYQSVTLVLISQALLQCVDAGRGASSLTLPEEFCISRDRLYISIAQFILKSSFLLCVLAVCHYDARGSSAVRTPSPIMLSTRSVTNRAPAGKKASHQAMRKYCCA